MKAAVMHEANKVIFEDMPTPTPKPNENSTEGKSNKSLRYRRRHVPGKHAGAFLRASSDMNVPVKWPTWQRSQGFQSRRPRAVDP